jgi:hypothetical protein
LTPQLNAGTVLAVTLFFVSRGWEHDKAEELFQIEGERQLTALNLGVASFEPDNKAVLSFMQLTPSAQPFTMLSLISLPCLGSLTGERCWPCSRCDMGRV